MIAISPSDGTPALRADGLSASTATTRVLLAEDDAEVRELIARFLRDHDCQVTEVAGGLELYNCLGECLFEGAVAPDVIVSDIRMPDFSGLEALRSAYFAELDIPFILMTAYSDASTRASAYQAGAVLLKKPFELEDLLIAVVRSARVGDAGRSP